MRPIKRYDKGGPVSKMSERAGSDGLGREEQLLADALSNQGYETKDLLSMLKLTKLASPAEKQAAMDAMFSGEAPGKAQVTAHAKDGKVRLSELKSEEEGYYPSRPASHASDEAYESIVGRELAPSEEKFMRKIMSDPALASYFMDVMGEASKDRAKVRVKRVGPRSTGLVPGSGGGGSKMHPSCRGGSCAFD